MTLEENGSEGAIVKGLSIECQVSRFLSQVARDMTTCMDLLSEQLPSDEPRSESRIGCGAVLTGGSGKAQRLPS